MNEANKIVRITSIEKSGAAKMAEIFGYQIIRDIQTGEHLTVYLVEDSVHGGTAILRLMNQPGYRETWNELYHRYKLKVKSHKYLPALKKIDSVDDMTYVVLEGSEGNLLEASQALTGRQIDQFVEAVLHLHQNQILLGKITRFNIWIRENGDISLYGAGERAVFIPESKGTLEDDLKHVLMIIKNHSSIPKSHFEGLSFESIGELQEWVLSKLAIPKPGLVDKGISSKTIFGIPDKKLEEPRESLPADSSPLPTVNRKKKRSYLFLLSVAALLLVVIFFSNRIISGSEQASKKVIKTKQTEDTAIIEEKKKDQPKNKDEGVNEVDLTHFAHLFPDRVIIQESTINLVGADYVLVATAQKRDEVSGTAKVSILSEDQTSGWKKVWESPEYESLLMEPETYVESFLTLTSTDGNNALLIFNLPGNESLGISEIKAFTIQANGSAEEVWNGFGYGIEEKDNKVYVTDLGLKELSITTGSFTLKEVAKGQAE